MLTGKWPGGELPKTVIEFLFCRRYGWTLKEVRKLRAKDVQAHLPLLVLDAKIEAVRTGLM